MLNAMPSRLITDIVGAYQRSELLIEKQADATMRCSNKVARLEVLPSLRSPAAHVDALAAVELEVAFADFDGEPNTPLFGLHTAGGRVVPIHRNAKDRPSCCAFFCVGRRWRDLSSDF